MPTWSFLIPVFNCVNSVLFFEDEKNKFSVSCAGELYFPIFYCLANDLDQTAI
jgi:hypothetical protein